MLVLTRKTDERIVIGDDVEVIVLSIHGYRVRLGIAAPAETTIKRGGLRDQLLLPGLLEDVEIGPVACCSE